MELPDYLPISMLNQLEYCPRRFWLMFVCGEMETNAPVAEGTLQHDRAHSGGATSEGEVVTQRRVTIGSERLKLLGVADIVEQQDGHLAPVEYKHGRMGKWLNDHVQLCAQAMCLEENPNSQDPKPQITHGEIFYWRSRRRVRVEFTPELRARTEAAVNRAFELLAQGEMPPPLPKELRAKCRDCSLEPVCLPEEVIMLSGG
jgi:CRISPR-associated exonuclease Cas4